MTLRRAERAIGLSLDKTEARSDQKEGSTEQDRQREKDWRPQDHKMTQISSGARKPPAKCRRRAAAAAWHPRPDQTDRPRDERKGHDEIRAEDDAALAVLIERQSLFKDDEGHYGTIVMMKDIFETGILITDTCTKNGLARPPRA
jgi:hypothetical protein